jgi:hypothetical protein
MKSKGKTYRERYLMRNCLESEEPDSGQETVKLGRRGGCKLQREAGTRQRREWDHVIHKKRMSEGGQIWWMYFIFMYENRIMKPVEIVLRRGRGNEGE